MKLCLVDTCQIHVPDCERDNCDCRPALAATGSFVCAHHADSTRDHLRELPELWSVLGAKPSKGGSEGGGTGEPPQPLSDDARTARSAMRAMLVTWCKVLEEERGSPLPDERVIAQRARTDVLRHQWDAQTSYQAARAEQDPVRRHNLHCAAAVHRSRAELAHDARLTDADIIEALREHIDRHLAWILANADHADQLVHDVQFAHHEARRTAYPTRAAIRILCACGRHVPINTEPGASITCPGCGEWGDLHWWRTREAPPVEGPLSLRDLPDWLFAYHSLIVTPKQLRNWRDRGYLTDAAAEGSTLLYDPEGVAVVAHARLGRRATA
jgi:hypothetical protein